MKVALILTGLMRCYDQAYPSFKQHFLDKYDCDVFIDTWSELGFYSGKGYLQGPQDFYIKTSENDRGFHDSKQLIDANHIISLYNPVTFNIQNFDMFESTFTEQAKRLTNAFTRPKNTLAQFYKHQSSIYNFVMTRNCEDYDLIVRARPDLFLETPLPELHPDVFYTLPSRNKNGTGTGDSIYISGITSMAAVTSQMTLDKIYQIYNEQHVSCPHLFTEQFIKKAGVKWDELKVNANIKHSPKGLYQEP